MPHPINNHSTGLAQTLRRMHLGNVLLLTGTPLQNKYAFPFVSRPNPCRVTVSISDLAPPPNH